MSRASDLAPLLAAAGGTPDIGFTQGVITSWDEATGTNSVRVGGTELTDLPALNLGDFVHLEVDDVVGLLRFKSTFFILGRIILPRGVDTNRSSLDFESRNAQATNFSLSTTLASKVAVNLSPPSWCDEAAVMVGQSGQAINSTASQDYLQLGPRVGGTNLTGQVGGAGGGGGSGFVSVTSSIVVTSPASPLVVDGMARAQFGAWAANASNSTNISVLALYRRVN